MAKKRRAAARTKRSSKRPEEHLSKKINSLKKSRDLHILRQKSQRNLPNKRNSKKRKIRRRRFKMRQK